MLVHNCIQALARLHVTQAWLRCAQAGIRVVSMEHDKLIAVVRETEAQAACDFMGQELARAPSWLPDIPLDSDGYISRTFAKP
jgi:DNA polymerase